MVGVGPREQRAKALVAPESPPKPLFLEDVRMLQSLTSAKCLWRVCLLILNPGQVFLPQKRPTNLT